MLLLAKLRPKFESSLLQLPKESPLAAFNLREENIFCNVALKINKQINTINPHLNPRATGQAGWQQFMHMSSADDTAALVLPEMLWDGCTSLCSSVIQN